MKWFNLILVLFTSILLVGCVPTHLIGTYHVKDGTLTLSLSKDSTFTYTELTPQYVKISSSGVWRKIDNAIYLNSYITENKIPLAYVKEKNEQKDNIRINIKVNVAQGKEKDYICDSFINGDIGYLDPKRGSYSFEWESGTIDSLYLSIDKVPMIFKGTDVSYKYVRTDIIRPQLLLGDKINITVNIIDTLFSYRVFQNEKLKIRNGKLLFKSNKSIFKKKKVQIPFAESKHSVM